MKAFVCAFLALILSCAVLGGVVVLLTFQGVISPDVAVILGFMVGTLSGIPFAVTLVAVGG